MLKSGDFDEIVIFTETTADFTQDVHNNHEYRSAEGRTNKNIVKVFNHIHDKCTSI